MVTTVVCHTTPVATNQIEAEALQLLMDLNDNKRPINGKEVAIKTMVNKIATLRTRI